MGSEVVSGALTLALQALLDEPVEQRAAVVAEREPLVGVHHEPVRHVHVEPLAAGHAHRARLLGIADTFKKNRKKIIKKYF